MLLDSLTLACIGIFWFFQYARICHRADLPETEGPDVLHQLAEAVPVQNHLESPVPACVGKRL